MLEGLVVDEGAVCPNEAGGCWGVGGMRGAWTHELGLGAMVICRTRMAVPPKLSST